MVEDGVDTVDAEERKDLRHLRALSPAVATATGQDSVLNSHQAAQMQDSFCAVPVTAELRSRTVSFAGGARVVGARKKTAMLLYRTVCGNTGAAAPEGMCCWYKHRELVLRLADDTMLHHIMAQKQLAVFVRVVRCAARLPCA